MSELRARKGLRTFLGLLAALGLVAALSMPAMAGADVDWATVTGYAEGTPENNDAETWGATCEDVATPEGGWGETYLLPELGEGLVYSLVVVKAGSDQSSDEGANTLFANPAAGETVWADSVADGEFGEGDKNISHMIVCTEEEEEEEEEPTPTPTIREEEEGGTPTPSPTIREDEQGGNPTPTPAEVPDTAMGQFGQVPATVLSLVLLGALAAMIYVRLARQR
ncbi:MAG TPA: hypothetical protein VF365_10815 [Candidatus Limnocylindria bacterium]